MELVIWHEKSEYRALPLQKGSAHALQILLLQTAIPDS
jgi:hypothetical protein